MRRDKRSKRELKGIKRDREDERERERDRERGVYEEDISLGVYS